MTMTREPGTAGPDIHTPAPGGRSGFRRILVPVRSASDADETLAIAARACTATNGLLQLVHVRIYDPPMRGAGRFYPQTRTEAEAVPDEALPMAWAHGFRATTAVVAAPRGEVASAIARQASAWQADMIVMTRRPGLALCRLVLGSVPDQVMRMAHCPVLAVRPGPKAARSVARSARPMGRSV
jgi:nucleotide-binding universal stress UspA family protein